MLGTIGSIFGIIAGIIMVTGALWVIFSFYAKTQSTAKNVVSIVTKVDRIERDVDALMLIHKDEVIALYKTQTSALSNPHPPADRDYLIQKLQDGIITDQEAARLEEILRAEQAEAERRNLGLAVLAIGALLALLYIITRKK